MGLPALSPLLSSVPHPFCLLRWLLPSCPLPHRSQPPLSPGDSTAPCSATSSACNLGTALPTQPSRLPQRWFLLWPRVPRAINTTTSGEDERAPAGEMI